MEYKIIKHIETLKKWSTVSLEFNFVKWGSSEAKYDIRKWSLDEPRKGVSLSKDEAELLYEALKRELGHDKEKDKEIENIETPLDYRNFVVHTNLTDCEKKGHDSEEITAIAPLYKDGKVKEYKFAARYCKTCKVYYISEMTYNIMKARGRLLCQLVSKSEYEQYKKEGNLDNLKPQSVLNIIGYSVDAQNEYPDHYRQTILKYAIEEKIITRKMAIEYLTFFIKMHESHENMKMAIEKWKKDRSFLTGYVEGKERLIGIKKIIM